MKETTRTIKVWFCLFDFDIIIIIGLIYNVKQQFTKLKIRAARVKFQGYIQLSTYVIESAFVTHRFNAHW